MTPPPGPAQVALSRRRLLRDDAALYGGAIAAAIFATNVWPLWARVLGWTCGLALLWLRPRLTPFRVWSHALERGGAERLRRRTGLRALLVTEPPANTARTDEYREVEGVRRLAREYLLQRTSGAMARVALSLWLLLLLVPALMRVLGSLAPWESLMSWDRTLWHPIQRRVSPVEWHAIAQAAVVLWLIGLSSLYRFERFQLEHPPISLAADARAALRTLSNHLGSGAATMAVWSTGGVVMLAIGYYMAIMGFFAATGRVLEPIMPTRIPQRPLVELLWLPVAGLAVWTWRERSLLRLAAYRQSLFAVSSLARRQLGNRLQRR